jgi:NCAIR mutase (PurE)-related protein
MLNSCAPGVAVVNIDNGYGAAALAWRIIALGGSREDPDDGGTSAR